jgi:hypothetical protein
LPVGRTSGFFFCGKGGETSLEGKHEAAAAAPFLPVQWAQVNGVFICVSLALNSNRRPAMNPERSFEQEQRAERVLQIAEDDLRRRMIEESPQIRHDVELMADMIRELVSLEREKRGLDLLRIDLYAAVSKRGPSPDFIGETRIGSNRFRVTGRWGLDPEDKKVLKITMTKKP